MAREAAKKDSVAKMKRTFLRMASPQGFDGNEKKRKATIVSMNVPPLLGRAGASYDVMVSLLDSVLPVTLTDVQRIEHYTRLEKLLANAAGSAAEAQRNAEADKFKLDLFPFSAYMCFLREIVHSLVMLASGQNIFQERDKGLFFANSAAVVHTEAVAAELKRYHMFREIVRTNGPTLIKLRETIRLKLPKADIDRLDTAASMYAAHLVKELSIGKK